MKELEKLFDSFSIRERADQLLIGLNTEEKRQWLHHPCTKYILLNLQGDYLDYHQAWEGGTFTSDKAEGTAQQSAKALGALEAIRLIVTAIEEIDYDNDKDDGL